MMNFDQFKYTKASVPKDANEQQKFFSQLEQEFYEEIKNSETAKAYFAGYMPGSIENFMKSYASKKAHLTQYYDYYSRIYHEREDSELYFQKKAEEMLQAILQKKLFDLQTRWRAGQLVIDEVDIAYDFEFWGNHILACPFIPEIRIDELELMKEYLLRFDEDDEAHDDYIDWQDYDTITQKNEYGDLEDMPEWYDFYDLRMGTRMNLLLPNLKGEAEDFYLSMARKSVEVANPPENSPELLPYLSGYGESLYDFSKHFETDKYFSTLFKYYNYSWRKENQWPNSEELNTTIQFLLNADRPIYLKSNLPWDKALLAAAKEYKNTKIAEALDFAYEEYLMMKELGLYNDKSPEEIKKEYNKDGIVQLFREKILEGRVKNGEPKDFNY